MSSNTNNGTTKQQNAGGGNNGRNMGGQTVNPTTTTRGVGISMTTPNPNSSNRRNQNKYQGANQQYANNMPKSFTLKIASSIEPIGTASENRNLHFYKVQK